MKKLLLSTCLMSSILFLYGQQEQRPLEISLKLYNQTTFEQSTFSENGGAGFDLSEQRNINILSPSLAVNWSKSLKNAHEL